MSPPPRALDPNASHPRLADAEGVIDGLALLVQVLSCVVAANEGVHVKPRRQ